ncbi:unnamed protein product [Notodromas monacha]|uniref:Uncharacterized protein n=1 Tax=Notodromas monacha TaxID=399045 RepID=A0A7R9C0K1_9CRUS|nr:unnamed protein product [Notodromas monacha]CAG0924095.1 unnamed protein product [Notodromas monacha]
MRKSPHNKLLELVKTNLQRLPLRIFEFNLALIPRVVSRSSKAGLVGGVEAVRRCRKSAADESVGPNLAKVEMDGEKTPLLLSASLHADRVKASF